MEVIRLRFESFNIDGFIFIVTSTQNIAIFPTSGVNLGVLAGCGAYIPLVLCLSRMVVFAIGSHLVSNDYGLCSSFVMHIF